MTHCSKVSMADETCQVQVGNQRLKKFHFLTTQALLECWHQYTVATAAPVKVCQSSV